MSKYQQRSAGTREFVIFAVIVLGGACAWQWYTRKPPIIQRVVVHDLPAPSPVQEAPPPVVVAPPAPRPQLAPIAAPAPRIVAIPAPPPTPEAQILEEQLHDAQTTAVQANAALDAAKVAAMQQLRNSPDYITAKTDLATKKAAKDAAVEKLRHDDSVGLAENIDQDRDDVQTTAADWLTASQQFHILENQNVDADPGVVQKQQAYRDAVAVVTDLQNRLTTCIQKMVATAATDDQCAVQSFAYDTTAGTILAVISPSQSLSPGESADRSIMQIGHILEKALHNAPFTWTTAIFRVYSLYNGSKAIEFQATYSRPAVDSANFATLDRGPLMDDQGLVNLAADFWLSPLINQMEGPRTIATANSVGGGGAGTDGQQVAAYSLPNAYMPGGSTVNYVNDILYIGGYRWMDGTYRAAFWVKRKHDDKHGYNPPTLANQASQGGTTGQAPTQSSAVQAAQRTTGAQQNTQSQSGQSSQQTKTTAKPEPAPPPKQTGLQPG